MQELPTLNKHLDHNSLNGATALWAKTGDHHGLETCRPHNRPERRTDTLLTHKQASRQAGKQASGCPHPRHHALPGQRSIRRRTGGCVRPWKGCRHLGAWGWGSPAAERAVRPEKTLRHHSRRRHCPKHPLLKSSIVCRSEKWKGQASVFISLRMHASHALHITLAGPPTVRSLSDQPRPPMRTCLPVPRPRPDLKVPVSSEVVPVEAGARAPSVSAAALAAASSSDSGSSSLPALAEGRHGGQSRHQELDALLH